MPTNPNQSNKSGNQQRSDISREKERSSSGDISKQQPGSSRSGSNENLNQRKANESSGGSTGKSGRSNR